MTTNGEDGGFHKAMLVNMETAYAQGYADGWNIFDIKLPRPQLGSVGKVLLALVSAIAAGQLMMLLLSPETLAVVNEKLETPAFSCIMKALGAAATYMIFTSIVVSVSCMQNLNALKTIGRDLFCSTLNA